MKIKKKQEEIDSWNKKMDKLLSKQPFDSARNAFQTNWEDKHVFEENKNQILNELKRHEMKQDMVKHTNNVLASQIECNKI